MPAWQPIETAPFSRDVIVLDKHEFVYRARRHKTGIVCGWVVMGGRWPVFEDNELYGWMPLPKPPEAA